MALDSLMKPYASLADALCARVGFRGISTWLVALAQYLNVPVHELMPEKLQESHQFYCKELNFSLTLRHPHAKYGDEGDPELWFIRDAIFYYFIAAEAIEKAIEGMCKKKDIKNNCGNIIRKSLVWSRRHRSEHRNIRRVSKMLSINLVSYQTGGEAFE